MHISKAILVLLAIGSTLSAAPLLTEGFDNITTLPGSGWVQVNRSSPLGPVGWFQGSPPILSSQDGAADSYIAANFESADGIGAISNWLITPTLILNNGDVLTFYTRTVFGSLFPDSLQVRLSSSGASTDVGLTATSVGVFTGLLLDITSYPQDWALQNVVVSGLPGANTSSRLAFRYYAADTSASADYIGIDTLAVTAQADAIPEPSTAALSMAGFVGILCVLRYRRRSLRSIS